MFSADHRSFLLAEAAQVDGISLRRNVAVVVQHQIISDVVSADAIGKVCLADAPSYRVPLLLPGLINAHCHLEYTHLKGRLPRGSVDFGRWIEAIGAAKRATTPEDYERSARDGTCQLLAGGCTTVIDTVTCPSVPSALSQGPLRYFLFCEVLGLAEETADRTFQAAEDHTRRVAGEGGGSDSPRRLHGVGINPHAPYSVGPYLRRRLRDYLTARPEALCSWHLGETRAEVELFEKGTGELAEFLSRNNLPFPFGQVPGCDPVTYLEREGLLDQCDMAFHLNWFPPEKARHFAAPRAVVHCPSTHAYFDREPFPMMRLLQAGANVCLATDSLASSETLSMLEVLRIAAREFPALTGPQLLDLVTRNPARSRVLSGAPAPLGVIAKGAAADFAALATPAEGLLTRPLRDILLDEATHVALTIVAGEPVWSAAEGSTGGSVRTARGDEHSSPATPRTARS